MSLSQQQLAYLCLESNAYLKYLLLTKNNDESSDEAMEEDIKKPAVEPSKPLLSNKRAKQLQILENRLDCGEFYKELRKNEASFYEYTRMTKGTFDYLVESVKDECFHCTTNFKKPISTAERMLIAIRFLVTGSSFRQLTTMFKISKTSIGNIIMEICKALWKVLEQKHLKMPTTEEFRKISLDFYNKTNFPNCFGRIDGKHIKIKCPKTSERKFAKCESVVLLAVTDANCRFVAIDIGEYGATTDGGIFTLSNLHAELEDNILPLPCDTCLPNSDLLAPFVLLGDETFPLKRNVLKPYPKRLLQKDDDKMKFNSRLKSARDIVQDYFDILTGKFDILHQPIVAKTDNVVHIIKAICVLHNVILDLEGCYESSGTTMPKKMKLRGYENFKSSRSNNATTHDAVAVRNTFCQYFANYTFPNKSECNLNII